MEDRSLDEFVDADGNDSGAEDGASEPEDPRGGPESERDGSTSEGSGSGDDGDASLRADPDEVEPAATTYAVGDGECAACGRSVRRRWRDDGGLVCPECKSW